MSLSLLAVAATLAWPTDTISTDRLVAHRTTDPPTIDGRLDDPAWQGADVATDFVQRIPAWGAAGTERTEVRVAWDAEALYVGVRAFDRLPDGVVAPLTRRDDTGGGDRISVFIDSWFDRRTGFAFTLSAAGVRSDAYLSDDSELDQSWDGTWQGATHRDREGWSAEFRIPLSQLRFKGGDDTRFGFNVARTVARRNEVMLWRPVPQDGSQFVSRFGTLEGLDGLRAPRRLEVMPYVSARERFDGAARNDALRSPTALSGTAGADLRMGLGSSLTLSAAINPDFAQLDGDPATVNLGADEVFLEERRRFFTEASDAFRVDLGSPGSPESLVYSRRIGRAPQLTVDDQGGSSRAPNETTILGATRLTGRIGSWSIAALGALTEAEHATILTPTEDRLHAMVEPRTLYAATRVGRDFRNGRTTLSGVGTVVNRELHGEAAKRLRGRAVVGGTDVVHRWGGGNAYRLRASITGSHVSGTPEAITATQRSAVRYLQRPDHDAGAFDSTRSSLTGWSGNIRLEREIGDWRWFVQGFARSSGFETNDLGFQFSAGQTNARAGLTRRWGRLGPFTNAEVSAQAVHVGTLDGDRINAALTSNLRGTLDNGWQLSLATWYRIGGLDVQALRGGPGLREPGNWFSVAELRTNPARRFSLTTRVDGWQYFAGASEGLRLRQQLTWRPVPRAELGVGASYAMDRTDAQFVGQTMFGGEDSWLVGELLQRDLSVTLRGGFTFSPELSLQLWAEPFLSSASYDRVRRVVDPRADRFADRLHPVEAIRSNGMLAVDIDGDGAPEYQRSDPDFSTASFRSNLVLRWEYRPSSVLFLVWQHGRSHREADGRFAPRALAGDLFRAPADHQLALKFTYWWTPLR